jgi:hypothetical protein
VNCNLKLREVLSRKTQHEIKRKEIETLFFCSIELGVVSIWHFEEE